MTAAIVDESQRSHNDSTMSLESTTAVQQHELFSTTAHTTSTATNPSPPQSPADLPIDPTMEPPTKLLRADYQALLEICYENMIYFKDDHTERGQRLHAAFIAWQDFIKLADQLVSEVESFAYKYDFDSETPGNGYRSFVSVTDACVRYGHTICKNLQLTRMTMFFRKKFYTKEVEACSQLLSSITTCLRYLLILHEWSCDSGDLFANGKHTAEELFELGETINQYSFYGRCLGFQYDDSMRGVLRFIAIGMASFSESYYAQETDGPIVKTTRSVWTSGKYFLNPELRARRIVNISQNAKIDFCKSFWFLAESELMHKIPSIVGSTIRVNRMIEIPCERLQMPRVKKLNNEHANITIDINQNDNADLVDIPVPTAHLGSGLPVKVRLLSSRRREGMLGESGLYSWRKMPARSPSILFHCHGGGFVAQSSKSHELYLRDWAVALDVPILSIDYSLAPEAPFPRALEEAFYAYCWLLKNAEHLGTTAERVVLAGDSAGANLCIGVTLKCIEMGIRIPDGIFLAYCPTLISFVPSPARLLCLMDPLLPFGFMMRCLRAYASPASDILAENAQHAEINASIRDAGIQESHLLLNTERSVSATSSRRTSAAKSPLSSLAENSKWEQLKVQNNLSNSESHDSTIEAAAAAEKDESSSDTFASASYHSQTVERTDLPSVEDDGSSCVSFEDDSQPIVHYPIEISAEMPKNSDSEQYIDRFLDKYLIDTATVEAQENTIIDRNGCPPAITSHQNHNGLNIVSPTLSKTRSEENLLIETGKEMIAIDTLHGRFNNAVNSITNKLSSYTKSYDIIRSRGASPHHQRTIQDLRNLDALIARSPSEEFAFNVPRDPFLSPYFASDEWLQQLPPTKILTLDMDPCLDDCVMFARKLKSLGRPVTLEILKGLPHGFLNFTMLSNEALEGSKHCIGCLQELLKMPEVGNKL